jgi:ubiquinone/menaquinone biosynthesis C-methylase UbiE
MAALSPRSVLETAAGTGVATRAMIPKLAPDARYVVTDLNQPMLDRAMVQHGSDSRLSWQQADALALPFKDAVFDVVCCQFGAMFLHATWVSRNRNDPSRARSRRLFPNLY